MSGRPRRNHYAVFKTKVALTAIMACTDKQSDSPVPFMKTCLGNSRRFALNRMPGFEARAASFLGCAAILSIQACSLSSATTAPSASPPSSTQPATALSSSAALYPRLVRLSHNANSAQDGNIVASVTNPFGIGGEEDFYGSSDGSSFSLIGTIQDPDFATGLCCGTLFELPSQVGSLVPGTLLWAGSVGQNATDPQMQIKVYESSNGGVSWTFLSNCDTSSNTGGIWEPQFLIANDGALVCIFSDESQAGYSQILNRARSYDGVNWEDYTYTVASSVQADRPGMAVTSELPSGIYFMSYEMCGQAACTVFDRTSPDGWNWGDATNVGEKVVTADGQFFEHAPTNAWAPIAGTFKGQILLVGQMLYNADGTVASGNGATIFTNSADGSGSWSTIASPVQVPDTFDNYCPNYSSALLPSLDGTNVLEFADDNSEGVCTMYFASGSTD